MRRAWLAPGLIVFIVLATMNSAGYRYGASDQAFYVPAIVRHLNPALFPNDRSVIDAQARLTLVDETLAGVKRLTHAPLPGLLLVLYLLTLALLFAGVCLIGRSLYRRSATVVALAAAMTLRHAIARTGANSLEGYFHPRQLAFALGLLAVAAFLRRKDAALLPLLAAAFCLHPTTAAWFVVWLTVAAWAAMPRWRIALSVAVVTGAAAVALALWRGPLAGHLIRIDPAWLAIIHEKDYLFPLEWPLTAWLTNFLPVVVIAAAWRARARGKVTVARETPLVLGALALLVLFAAWLPFDAAHLALAVQLQTSRVFWMLDTLAIVYLVWAIAEGAGAASVRRSVAAAALIAACAAGRGWYSKFVSFPDRALFSVGLEHADWRDAAAWARTTDPASQWLADPFHAARYGTSLRVAAERDVLLEQLKDPAIAMYDRGVAMRVADRERALALLPWNTADGARALARRYGLDYLLTEQPIDLPLAHRSGSILIYRLR